MMIARSRETIILLGCTVTIRHLVKINSALLEILGRDNTLRVRVAFRKKAKAT